MTAHLDTQLLPGDRRWVLLDVNTTNEVVAGLDAQDRERILPACRQLARLWCSTGLPHLVTGRLAGRPVDLAANQLLAPAASVFAVPPDEVVTAFRDAQSAGRSCSWYVPVPIEAPGVLESLASALSTPSRLLICGAGSSSDFEFILRELHGAFTEAWVIRDAVATALAIHGTVGSVSLTEVKVAHDRWAAGL